MKAITVLIGCATVLASGCVRPDEPAPHATMHYTLIRTTPLGSPDRWD